MPTSSGIYKAPGGSGFTLMGGNVSGGGTASGQLFWSVTWTDDGITGYSDTFSEGPYSYTNDLGTFSWTGTALIWPDDTRMTNILIGGAGTAVAGWALTKAPGCSSVQVF